MNIRHVFIKQKTTWRLTWLGRFVVLFVILAIIIGGYFYGIIGMVLSVPIMIILQTAFEISVAKYNKKPAEKAQP